MPCHTGELNSKKYLLASPFPVPAVIQTVFTMVFFDAFHLIEYMHRHMTETTGYYLIIHQDVFDYLLIDQINANDKIIRIYVICDDMSEQEGTQRCLSSKCNKIQLWTLDNLPKLFDRFVNEQALCYSDLMYNRIQAGIHVIIQTWCICKQMYISNQRVQIAQRLPSIVVHGYSVDNSDQFDWSDICPSCHLIYNPNDQLRCRHRTCRVCFQVQKSCTQCLQDLIVNQMTTTATTTTNFQIDMPNQRIMCVHCSQTLRLNNYEWHLKTKHLSSLARFISNAQVVGNVRAIFTTGSCIWEIRNFHQQQIICNDSPCKSIYSPAFYLSPNGYRMRLRLFINGNGSGKGTHMSLFYVIMRGDYDDELQWPFNHRAKFLIVDQAAAVDDVKDHWIVSFPSKSNSQCFDRPIWDMNDGFGIQELIPSEIVTRIPSRYVKQGAMFIQFSVDLTNTEHVEPMFDDEGEPPNDNEHVLAPEIDIIGSICGDFGMKDYSCE